MGKKASSSDALLPTATRQCQCTICGKYFNSVSAFDMHRESGVCLDARKMRRKGMSRNERGYWIERGWGGGDDPDGEVPA